MDNNDLMSSISEIFKNPEAQSKIQGITQMFSSSGNEPQKRKDDLFGEEMFSYMGKMMESFNRHDNRIDLLNSIRPYLREKRADNIDMAIRVIRLMNLAKNFTLKDVEENVSDL